MSRALAECVTNAKRPTAATVATTVYATNRWTIRESRANAHTVPVAPAAENRKPDVA